MRGMPLTFAPGCGANGGIHIAFPGRANCRPGRSNWASPNSNWASPNSTLAVKWQTIMVTIPSCMRVPTYKTVIVKPLPEDLWPWINMGCKEYVRDI